MNHAWIGRAALCYRTANPLLLAGFPPYIHPPTPTPPALRRHLPAHGRHRLGQGRPPCPAPAYRRGDWVGAVNRSRASPRCPRIALDTFSHTYTRKHTQSSGSGCATAVLARTLQHALGQQHHRTLFLATDLNPKAARATAATGAANGVAPLEVVQGDLLTNVRERLEVIRVIRWRWLVSIDHHACGLVHRVGRFDRASDSTMA